jgi:hypothetical protein
MAHVAGYAWPQSVARGEAVALHLSAQGGPVEVEVARVGLARDVLWRATVEGVGDHPLPPDAATHGCRWPVAVQVPVGRDWPSGFYEIALRVAEEVDESFGAGDGGATASAQAFVVVRPPPDSDRRTLLVLATNTWHAYNDTGGANLYTGATQVSLQRPMAPGFLAKPDGRGQRVAAAYGDDPRIADHVRYLLENALSEWAGSAGWPNWELPFVRWAEAHGHRLDVVANPDVAADPDLLGRYALVLSVGHDEYWTGAMRDAVEGFVAGGGNVAFLSGNSVFWQVRFEDDGTTMVGYKQHFSRDPLLGTDREGEVTTLWSDRLLDRPENRLTGVSMVRGGYARIGRRVPRGSGGYTVHRPDHWLFAGTGLAYGDLLGAESTVVGYECDGCAFTTVDGLPVPTGEDGTPPGFTILATSPAQAFAADYSPRPVRDDEVPELEFNAWRVLGDRSPEAQARLAHGHAVLGTHTAGGTVVTTGCTDWVHGLSGRSPAVETITGTILGRLG